jgi:hypothetical protein
MGSLSSSLLRRSPLLPGESLSSLLIRLADLNHYDSPTMVVRLCRERLAHREQVTRPRRTETYRALTGLTGIEADKLYAASVHQFAAVITPPHVKPQFTTLPSGEAVPILTRAHSSHVRFDETQFCPLCLKELAYHRLAWMSLAVSVCLDHRCLLLHSCPDCQARIRIRDVLKAQCHECGFDLAEAPTISLAADEFGLSCQAAIQSWLCTPPDADLGVWNLGLPDEPPAVLYRVVDGLCRILRRTQDGWGYLHKSPPIKHSQVLPCETKSDFTPAKSYILYTTAFKSIVAWPRGFSDFLEACERTDGLSKSQTADPGRMRRTLAAKSWNHASLNFVQDAYDQYLVKRSVEHPFLVMLGRLRSKPALKAKLPYVTYGEAAHMLETTWHVITSLVRGRFLTVYEVPTSSEHGSIRRLVSRAEVVGLRRQWSEAISLKEAAYLLGMPEDVVLGLARSGVITILRGPGVYAGHTWQLSSQSLASLLARLRDSLKQCCPTSEILTLNFAKATQKLSTYGFDAVSVILHILNGRLRGYRFSAEYGLNHLQISSEDVEDLAAHARVNCPSISERYVADILQVTTATIAKWAENGLLTPAEMQDCTLYFDRDTVEEFTTQYVFSNEAASILGVSPLSFNEWLRGKSLWPVSGPYVDRCHRNLYRRADVEQLRQDEMLRSGGLGAACTATRRSLGG